jgi:hypothetical protein
MVRSRMLKGHYFVRCSAKLSEVQLILSSRISASTFLGALVKETPVPITIVVRACEPEAAPRESVARKTHEASRENTKVSRV